MKMIFGGMIYLINKFCLYKYLNVVAVRKIGDQTTIVRFILQYKNNVLD